MVVLINVFEVRGEVSDDEFLAGWQRAADYLERQPGFLRTELHRAISPDARFRFVNVAEWESPDAFRNAVTGEGFRRIAETNSTPNYPGLFEVVRTATRPAAASSGVAKEGAPA